MTTKICDRCGAEIFTAPWKPITFPWFSIVRCDYLNESSHAVDLCKRCEKDFEKWLKDKPKEGEDEAQFEKENSIVEISFEEYEKMKKGKRR